MGKELSFGAELDAMMDALIEQGRYRSRHDIVMYGLHLVEEREAQRQWKIEKLRAFVQEGIDSGPGIPADEVFDRLEAKYAAMTEKPDAAE